MVCLTLQSTERKIFTGAILRTNSACNSSVDPHTSQLRQIESFGSPMAAIKRCTATVKKMCFICPVNWLLLAYIDPEEIELMDHQI